MKTLIFNGSPRKNGGTSALINRIKSYLPGKIDVIDAYRANIRPCNDCRYCWTNDKCAVNDEMRNVYRLIDEADNIIIASPIYFAELTGQLLSLMSRLQYLWIARNIRNTEVLSQKKRSGAFILVDAGQGYADAAKAMANRLLRTMNTESVGSVYFSGTENVPQDYAVVPKNIYAEIEELASKLIRNI